MKREEDSVRPDKEAEDREYEGFRKRLKRIQLEGQWNEGNFECLNHPYACF